MSDWKSRITLDPRSIWALSIGGIVMSMFAMWLVILLMSLPLALIGWAVMTVISLFGPDVGDAFTYMTYVAVGIAIVIVIGLLRTIFTR